MFLASNAEHQKMQIWNVPAGQGKSRIAGAAAYYFLMHTKKEVYIVFENERLMKDDRRSLENIMQAVKA
jgi:superfamily II DNA or RNA helicase